MNLSRHQAFVTVVGQRVDRRKTAENIYGTLASILNLGQKWGYAVPSVEKRDIVFPADKRPQPQTFSSTRIPLLESSMRQHILSN
jgi:hypothetical protein